MKVSLNLHILPITYTYPSLMIYYLFSESTQDNSDVVTELNMWSDDLENDLVCAIRDQQLNDFLVSLAPHVSLKYVPMNTSTNVRQFVDIGYTIKTKFILQNVERYVRGVCASISNAKQSGKSGVVFTRYTQNLRRPRSIYQCKDV